MAWLSEAARRNNSAAQRSLGHFYLRGHGVRQDNKTGIAWIARAAKSGDAGAQVCCRMLPHADVC
jgi:TPR repeat protein